MENNLKDVTFTIPVCYDTDDRIQNAKIVLDYLSKHFDTNIILIEESLIPRFDIFKDIKNLKYIYLNSPQFHRTKCLNLAARASVTPIVVNYDIDVLFCINQYLKSVELIRSNKFDMVLPYAGKALNFDRQKIKDLGGLEKLASLNDSFKRLMNVKSVGGAVFWNKQKFFDFGLENEKFKLWGCEDNERLARAEILGVRITRVPGILYHIDHQNLVDSTRKNKFYKENQKEYKKVAKMSKSELQDYIRTWKYAKL